MFTKVSIDIRKLRDYCLNPYHPIGKHKARVFSSQLGIEKSDAQWLKDTIVEKIKDAEIEWLHEDEYGKRCSANLRLACIIHQEICLWTRRLENGGGNVHVYVEQTIFEITQSTGKFCRN